MDDLTLHQEREAALATALRSLWEQAHGVATGQVRVLIGPESVAAWIEDSFSPAERVVAQHTERQSLIQHYVEQLLAVVQPDLWTQVEIITGRMITSGSVRADVDKGHVLCFFILGEPWTLPPTPNPKNMP